MNGWVFYGQCLLLGMMRKKEMKNKTDDRLRRRLQKDEILVVPAAFDVIPAKIIEKEGSIPSWLEEEIERERIA